MRDLYTVTDSDDSDDDDDEDEEEPLIVQLMESMFNRKKTVYESQQMISEISLDAIRQEVRDMALAEKTRLANLERSKKFEKRMRDCERLNDLL
jgi:hypothetical protein